MTLPWSFSLAPKNLLIRAPAAIFLRTNNLCQSACAHVHAVVAAVIMSYMCTFLEKEAKKEPNFLKLKEMTESIILMKGKPAFMVASRLVGWGMCVCVGGEGIGGGG